MTKEMSREERLGRSLLKIYGFTFLTKDEAINQMRRHKVSESDIDFFKDERQCKFVAKLSGPGMYWTDDCVYSFYSWSDVIRNINDHIRYHSKNWKSYKGKISTLIPYNNIDELDIQLTLIGANGI